MKKDIKLEWHTEKRIVKNLIPYDKNPRILSPKQQDDLMKSLKKFNKFQKGVLQLNNSSTKHRDIDLKTYIKYTLREGSKEEKRELMGCFKSRIKVTDGVVVIE
jgi:hypothetical protein